MLLTSIARVRNIGIVAHIDAGKTTTTERFLYYAGLTHRIGEVHDGNTVMDFRDDERERGITISAAATTFVWNNYQINLIDTPGHIDFTAEVERSLRVLDGAVVVFSGVEGVEPQSETVWHQADRYRVPRIAFVNKLDRVGADHERVLQELQTRLGARAAFVNLPHGLEGDLDGVIDVVEGEWLVFDEETRGLQLERRPVPNDARAATQAARERLVEQVAETVEWLADLYVTGEPVTADNLRRAIREATLASAFVPVLCGAALRDLGIRPILDAVCAFLPSPADRPPAAGVNPDTGRGELRPPLPSEPFSALVFKVVAHSSADLFWLRVYSGAIGVEDRCYHPRSETRIRLRRLLRIHADRTEPVLQAHCGDILAVPGLKGVFTGDTLCDPDRRITFEAIRFPDAVVSVAVEAQTSGDRDKLLDVTAQLVREDPTFSYHTDDETGQLILSGMGELHLEILGKRMEREFGVQARFGRPRVAYRETVVEAARGIGEFDRRIGDTQMTARAVVDVAPRPRPAGVHDGPPVEITIAPQVRHAPPALAQMARRVLADVCSAGGRSGLPVVDIAIHVSELSVTDVADPSVPLLAALTTALRKAFGGARTRLLEPVMRVDVRVPDEFVGAVVRDLSVRRAEISQTSLQGASAVVRATTPLAEMFGYSTQLRSLTQGRGSFSMEPFDYQLVPDEVANRHSSLA